MLLASLWQAVQAAVNHQLEEMKEKFPDRRVALVAFNNEVSRGCNTGHVQPSDTAPFCSHTLLQHDCAMLHACSSCTCSCCTESTLCACVFDPMRGSC